MSHTLLAATDTPGWRRGGTAGGHTGPRGAEGLSAAGAGKVGGPRLGAETDGREAVMSRRSGRRRRMRTENPRRPARTRRYADETALLVDPFDSLDPRDPDIVRAKRLRARDLGSSGRA